MSGGTHTTGAHGKERNGNGGGRGGLGAPPEGRARACRGPSAQGAREQRLGRGASLHGRLPRDPARRGPAHRDYRWCFRFPA